MGFAQCVSRQTQRSMRKSFARAASGKTRALEILSCSCRSVKTINVSVAYLFRKVGSDEGSDHPFDEIDTISAPRPGQEDIRGS